MPLEDYVRRGDYLVPTDTLEAAERDFNQRSARSKATDLAMRAPITTDYRDWKAVDGRGLDYPGVDTPTAEPRLAAMDHIGLRPRMRLSQGAGALRGEAILSEDPEELRRPPSVTGTIGLAAERIWEASGVVAETARPGSAPFRGEPR